MKAKPAAEVQPALLGLSTVVCLRYGADAVSDAWAYVCHAYPYASGSVPAQPPARERKVINYSFTNQLIVVVVI